MQLNANYYRSLRHHQCALFLRLPYLHLYRFIMPPRNPVLGIKERANDKPCAWSSVLRCWNSLCIDFLGFAITVLASPCLKHQD